jgi:hypothetical protein
MNWPVTTVLLLVSRLISPELGLTNIPLKAAGATNVLVVPDVFGAKVNCKEQLYPMV